MPPLSKPTKVPQLFIEVCHGSAHVAEHPVWISQIPGDPPSSAATALDVVLGGQLKALLAAGVLGPAPDGSIDLGRSPAQSCPGVYVTAIEQLPSEVRASLRRAAERVALKVLIAHARSGAVGDAGMACVLPDVTRWARTVDVMDLVVGVIEGVAAAERRLREMGPAAGSTVGLQRLQFFEVRKDLATRIAHALRECEYLLDGGPWSLKFAHKIRQEEGFLEGGPRHPRQVSDVLRLKVTQPEDARILFAWGPEGTESRESIEHHRLTIATPTDIVADALADPPLPASEDFNYLPSHIREAFEAGAVVQVVCGDRLAERPWELFARRAGDESDRPMPVILRALDETREGPEARRRMSAGRRALVVGHPEGDGERPLPFAREEAQRVARTLVTLGYEVDLIVGAEGMSVGEARALLRRGAYRIVHIASHGEFRDDGSARVMMGPEEITVDFWRGCESVPEVVTLNACSAGRVAVGYEGQAENLAATIVRSGVRVFIGSAWRVADGAAAAFGERLYAALARELPLADALRSARRAALQAVPERATWAALQVYGDPNTVLGRGSPTESGLSAVEEAVSDAEVAEELKSLIGRVRYSPREARPELRAELRKTVAVIERDAARGGGATHRYAAEVCESLGNLFMDLGELESAVQWNARALCQRKGTNGALLWWIEGSSRLLVRGNLDSNEGDRIVAEADALASRVTEYVHLRFHARLRLAAALARRQYSPERVGALVEEALRVAQGSFAKGSPGASDAMDRRLLWCDWVALHCVWHGTPQSEHRARLRDRLTHLRGGARRGDREYARILPGHIALAEALADGELTRRHEQVANAYVNVLGRRAVLRWLEFVIDDLTTLTSLAEIRRSMELPALNHLTSAVCQHRA